MCFSMGRLLTGYWVKRLTPQPPQFRSQLIGSWIFKKKSFFKTFIVFMFLKNGKFMFFFFSFLVRLRSDFLNPGYLYKMKVGIFESLKYAGIKIILCFSKLICDELYYLELSKLFYYPKKFSKKKFLLQFFH